MRAGAGLGRLGGLHCVGVWVLVEGLHSACVCVGVCGLVWIWMDTRLVVIDLDCRV